MWSAGSSPLARGLPRLTSQLRLSAGIIPARAGFTTARPPPTRPTPDHPRSRGVYHQAVSRSRARTGSSPLARGLPRAVGPAEGVAGIIPARAGFTRSEVTPALDFGDHPRSRGVYSPTVGIATKSPGSSPLARGLRAGSFQGVGGGGIIPARAGFTSTHRPRNWCESDHPRSRGVYAAETGSTPGIYGSSPLARGLPPRTHRPPGSHRIIPARAGFTRTPPSPASHPPDHPRSRGVYPRTPHTSTSGGGIIPARAGFTLADPWNPNDEPHYQTAFAFTADLVLAPQSSDSAVVSQRSTRTPSEA